MPKEESALCHSNLDLDSTRRDWFTKLKEINSGTVALFFSKVYNSDEPHLKVQLEKLSHLD